VNSSALQNLIESATVGDIIDLKIICQTLDVKLKVDDNLQDLCRVGVNDQQQTTVWFNANLDKKTKFTFVAIAIAEHIINPDKVAETGVVYDVFFLRELNKNKRSKLLMLATRLAVPEDIIEKISQESEVSFSREQTSDKFNVDTYIAKSNYLPEFIRCAIKQSTGMFLLDNLS